jgi:hypothetical protein
MRTPMLLRYSSMCLTASDVAQSTALLTGTVADASAAVIAGSEVVCRNIELGVKFSARVNDPGLFRFADLPVGSYNLIASHDGFETYVRRGINLLTGQTVDLTLL